MTARKRKQPDKKKKPIRKGPGIAMRSLTLVGQTASRNPTVFGGAAAFCVVFSFVTANAIWYQPGAHPSPFLRTRLPFAQSHNAVFGVKDTTPAPTANKVTTFVIQREGEEPADDEEAAGEEAATAGTADVETGTVTPAASTKTADASAPSIKPAAAGSILVADIQKELARRGLYDGPADGRSGPKTSAAILRFEKQTGRPGTGVASDGILRGLRDRAQQVAAVTPAERPYETVKAGKGDLDAVAAAIRNADIDPQFIPKADIPGSSELVMNIQKGLINLAYAEVTVDGVAGEQTRSAIRHFEKHYRLPETGQPSDIVLKKMKEIGAL